MRTGKILLPVLFACTLLGAPPRSAAADEDWAAIAALCEDPDLSKMTSELHRMHVAVAAGDSLQEACGRYAPGAERDGQVQCVVGVTGLSEDLLHACAVNDLQVLQTYSGRGYHALTVLCGDLADLEALARRSDVRGITPGPVVVTQTGSVVTEGDAAFNADDARSKLGVDGRRVRVGVISDSLSSPFATTPLGGTLVNGIVTGMTNQLSGDLPPEIRAFSLAPPIPVGPLGLSGTTQEGAAMLELVHDVAPRAGLSFATGFVSHIQFAQTIRDLAADPGFECDVIVDDVLLPREPVYQDGLVAEAIDDVVADGVAYFSAAGNQFDRGHERTYTDRDPANQETTLPATGVDFHDFGLAKGQTSNPFIRIPAGPSDTITVVVHWDEPYGGTLAAGTGSQANLDIYLLHEPILPVTPGNIAASATTVQGTVGSPAGDAYEILRFTPPGQIPPFDADAIYHLAVDHRDGRSAGLLIHVAFIETPPLAADQGLLGDRVLFGHTAAAGAMSVAAMAYQEITSSNHSHIAPAGQRDVNDFSSLGGNIPIWFAGSPLVRLATPVLRLKPDVTGPDGGATSMTPKFSPFKGTSASAPHVAAVAALMKSADPAITPGEIYQALKDTALEAESPGPDGLSGAGLVDAHDAVLAVLESFIQVPGDHSTIQAAIDAASDGDGIRVAPGLYKENIDFKGKNIVLRSKNPLSSTVVSNTKINGRKLGPTVTLAGTETEGAMLQGFRINNGKANLGSGSGGGINGQGASPIIENNVIRDNIAILFGGGIYRCNGLIQENTIKLNTAGLDGGGLGACGGLIRDNVIKNNDAEFTGGGLYQCDGTVQDNLIHDNTADAGGGLSHSDGTIQNNLIHDNTAKFSGGGLYECDGDILDNEIESNRAKQSDGGGLYECDGIIARNLILRNKAKNTNNTKGGHGGGLAFCDAFIRNNVIAFNKAKPNKNGGGLYECRSEISFNTIWGNTAKAGGGLHSCGTTSSGFSNILGCIIFGNSSGQVANSATPDYSCIQNWTGGGTGNITANPLLVAPNSDDYHLQATSPCLAAGPIISLCFLTPTLCIDFEGDPRPEFSSPTDIGADEVP